ncbi:hypothetical protein [Asticcacaulis sp. 201]|uniref:hypothetical protein n=1 Tax=Asticcacaulis sp. 201 TaxID=3028787 RepID=UPI00291668D2|nr:hypothetical protein [Asticcacaulis sp. 201]MDV6330009.1 hypothetical protein [Asticcacaulis sp. 201]
MPRLALARLSLTEMLADADSRAGLTADAQALILAETAATEAEIGRIIFGLLVMYEGFERRGEQVKTMVVAQWRHSLGGWPADVLHAAAQRWLNGPKAAFVPQPGDVLGLCEEIGGYRRALARKAARFLAATETERCSR